MNTLTLNEFSFKQVGLYSLIVLSTLILFSVSGALPADFFGQMLIWSCETVGIPYTVTLQIIDYTQGLSNALTIS